MSKLYVGSDFAPFLFSSTLINERNRNLSWSTNDDALRDAFSSYGEVTDTV